MCDVWSERETVCLYALSLYNSNNNSDIDNNPNREECMGDTRSIVEGTSKACGVWSIDSIEIQSTSE